MIDLQICVYRQRDWETVYDYLSPYLVRSSIVTEDWTGVNFPDPEPDYYCFLEITGISRKLLKDLIAKIQKEAVPTALFIDENCEEMGKSIKLSPEDYRQLFSDADWQELEEDYQERIGKNPS